MKNLILREAADRLNTITGEINDATGETLMWEFLANPQQMHVLQSRIEVAAKVNIDFKEAIGHRAKEVVIERTIRACDQMIKLLEESKAKLEAL